MGSSLIKTAQWAAVYAGDFLLGFQSQVIKLKKPRKDFLTDVDLKSEEIIFRILDDYASFAKYSEEAGGKVDENKQTWIIDPLDGTRNYFRQSDDWAVTIALAEGGEVDLSVICLPAKDKLIIADRDGSFVSTKSINLVSNYDLRVNDVDCLGEAVVWLDWTKVNYPDVTLKLLEKLARATPCPSLPVCSAIGFTEVASGRISGFINPAPPLEDFVSGAFIVEKAGGKVTDLEGNPWSLFSKSIVATNGLIHDQLLSVLNS